MSEKLSLVLTAIIIKDEVSGTFTGVLKEIDGVIAEGISEEDVMSQLPKSLISFIEASREDVLNEIPKHKTNLVTERELVFAQ